MKIVKCLTIGFLVSATAFVAYSVFLYWQAPVDRLRGHMLYTPPNATVPRDIGLSSPNNLPFPSLPADLVLEILLAEDIWFLQHKGINPPAIQRAITDFLVHNQRLRGASTLSQQLIKNVFLSPVRSFYRKYVEALYAIKLERHFTKEEIFSLYSSMAEIAPGVYGMKEGAAFYFHKPLPALSVAEGAFLAAVLRRPNWLRHPTCPLVGSLKFWTGNILVRLQILHRYMDRVAPGAVTGQNLSFTALAPAIAVFVADHEDRKWYDCGPACKLPSSVFIEMNAAGCAL
jgi:membrane peptidoglycan carboxypeptidase